MPHRKRRGRWRFAKTAHCKFKLRSACEGRIAICGRVQVFLSIAISFNALLPRDWLIRQAASQRLLLGGRIFMR
jgi:hypothetical protein